jgi:hypothetical protein
LVDVAADGDARHAFGWRLDSENMTVYRSKGMKSRACRRAAWTFALLLIPVSANAHDGPPFPIIVDQNVGPCVISVWTDPDVGTGTFFVIVNPLPGGEVPSDLKVQVSVEPVSGRLKEVSYPAERENLRGQVQYKALVAFDAQENWRVRVQLSSAKGSGAATATVEATPPGLGRWDLLLYLAPFLAVGFLWALAVLRRRSRKQSSQ